jgi:hypothetical protein
MGQEDAISVARFTEYRPRRMLPQHPAEVADSPFMAGF